MHDDFELIIDDFDFKAAHIEYYDIEINSPVTEEDIRYAQLEDLIFKKNGNGFNGSNPLIHPTRFKSSIH